MPHPAFRCLCLPWLLALGLAGATLPAAAAVLLTNRLSGPLTLWPEEAPDRVVVVQPQESHALEAGPEPPDGGYRFYFIRTESGHAGRILHWVHEDLLVGGSDGELDADLQEEAPPLAWPRQREWSFFGFTPVLAQRPATEAGPLAGQAESPVASPLFAARSLPSSPGRSTGPFSLFPLPRPALGKRPSGTDLEPLSLAGPAGAQAAGSDEPYGAARAMDARGEEGPGSRCPTPASPGFLMVPSCVDGAWTFIDARSSLASGSAAPGRPATPLGTGSGDGQDATWPLPGPFLALVFEHRPGFLDHGEIVRDLTALAALADLRDAVFLDGADLRGADFRGKNLRGALLDRTDCAGAHFDWLDLSMTGLDGTRCAGASFAGAILHVDQAQALREQGIDLAALGAQVGEPGTFQLPKSGVACGWGRMFKKYLALCQRQGSKPRLGVPEDKTLYRWMINQRRPARQLRPHTWRGQVLREIPKPYTIVAAQPGPRATRKCRARAVTDKLQGGAEAFQAHAAGPLPVSMAPAADSPAPVPDVPPCRPRSAPTLPSWPGPAPSAFTPAPRRSAMTPPVPHSLSRAARTPGPSRFTDVPPTEPSGPGWPASHRLLLPSDSIPATGPEPQGTPAPAPGPGLRAETTAFAGPCLPPPPEPDPFAQLPPETLRLLLRQSLERERLLRESLAALTGAGATKP
jgi:hypothetical protein